MDKVLPQGYYILDSEEDPHDGDADDGRYGLYIGDPHNGGEFFGCSHDRDFLIDAADIHAKSIRED